MQDDNGAAARFWLRSSRVLIASGLSPRSAITQRESSGGATSNRADHETMVIDIASLIEYRSWGREDILSHHRAAPRIIVLPPDGILAKQKAPPNRAIHDEDDWDFVCCKNLNPRPSRHASLQRAARNGCTLKQTSPEVQRTNVVCQQSGVSPLSVLRCPRLALHDWRCNQNGNRSESIGISLNWNRSGSGRCSIRWH